MTLAAGGGLSPSNATSASPFATFADSSSVCFSSIGDWGCSGSDSGSVFGSGSGWGELDRGERRRTAGLRRVGGFGLIGSSGGSSDDESLELNVIVKRLRFAIGSKRFMFPQKVSTSCFE